MVSIRPWVAGSCLRGELRSQCLTRPLDLSSLFAAAGAAAMPARHACADALASSAAPGSGARQTARSRCGRRSARPARDCRCPRAEGRPSPGRRRPVDALITRCGRRGGDAREARMCRCAGEQRRAVGLRAVRRKKGAEAPGSFQDEGNIAAEACRDRCHDQQEAKHPALAL